MSCGDSEAARRSRNQFDLSEVWHVENPIDLSRAGYLERTGFLGRPLTKVVYESRGLNREMYIDPAIGGYLEVLQLLSSEIRD